MKRNLKRNSWRFRPFASGQMHAKLRSSAALVPNLFVSCEEFLRSALGRGGRELPIFDCPLPRCGGLMDIGGSCHTTFSIVNRQSAIDNENLVFGCDSRLRRTVSRWVARAMPRRSHGRVLGPHASFLGVNQPVRFEEPECMTLWPRCS